MRFPHSKETLQEHSTLSMPTGFLPLSTGVFSAELSWSQKPSDSERATGHGGALVLGRHRTPGLNSLEGKRKMLKKCPKKRKAELLPATIPSALPPLGPPLTILPISPANVTPLLARCSWEPVLLPLREFLRMMPGSRMREGEH